MGQRSFHVSLLLFVLHVRHITAQAASTVQGDWVNPFGEDNSTVLTVGESFEIEWTSYLWTWFGSYAPSADVTNVDLWLCGFDQHQFQTLASSRVNVNESTSNRWTVQLPPDDLAQTPYWVFRFVPSGFIPNETSQSVSSPGVFVQNRTETATTSTVATSSSPTTTPTTSGITTDPSGSTTASPTPTIVPQPGLSTGAIAGIVVGAVAGGIALIALGWFFARRRSKSSQTLRPTDSIQQQQQLVSGYERKELAGTDGGFHQPPHYKDRSGAYQQHLGQELDNNAAPSRFTPRAELGLILVDYT